MKRVKKLICCVVSIHSIVMAQMPVNKIKRVLHHQGKRTADGQQDASVESGKVVFYFAHKPMINTLSSDTITKDKKEVVLLFPRATIGSAALLKKLALIAKQSGSQYQIQLQEVAAPTKGVRMVITYNYQTVRMKYELFESIGSQQGLVFTFYNKQFLDAVKKYDDAILQFADAKKKNWLSLTVDMGAEIQVL